MLRDFNGHDRWHPIVRDSVIERGRPSDRVGCVRRFHLQDGSELREQLLTLSDADMAFSYCLLDTPMPLLNYVAHVRLVPVTDGDRTFWHWESRFDTPAGREAELAADGGRERLSGRVRRDPRAPGAGGGHDGTVETYPTLAEAARRAWVGRGLSSAAAPS